MQTTARLWRRAGAVVLIALGLAVLLLATIPVRRAHFTLNAQTGALSLTVGDASRLLDLHVQALDIGSDAAALQLIGEIAASSKCPVRALSLDAADATAISVAGLQLRPGAHFVLKHGVKSGRYEIATEIAGNLKVIVPPDTSMIFSRSCAAGSSPLEQKTTRAEQLDVGVPRELRLAFSLVPGEQLIADDLHVAELAFWEQTRDADGVPVRLVRLRAADLSFQELQRETLHFFKGESIEIGGAAAVIQSLLLGHESFEITASGSAGRVDSSVMNQTTALKPSYFEKWSRMPVWQLLFGLLNLVVGSGLLLSFGNDRRAHEEE